MDANMVYLGGKSRIAKKIANVILSRTTDRDVYLEPFVGGASVFVEMAPHFKRPIASDLHPDLIAMWQAVAKGWEPPYITKERYYELKAGPVCAERGFAGFACSFSGKWWGGYAKPNSQGNDYVKAAQRSVTKSRFPRAAFLHTSYDYWTPAISKGVVVYADPPYADTTSYSTNAGDVWPTFDKWAEQGAQVFVSEYKAPAHWTCIADFPLRLMTEGRGCGEIRTERLFTR